MQGPKDIVATVTTRGCPARKLILFEESALQRVSLGRYDVVLICFARGSHLRANLWTQSCGSLESLDGEDSSYQEQAVSSRD
jgi:hypothetical protein